MPTELEAVAAEAAGCTRCRLHQSRTQVVFGQGDPHADLMFVGEAPGFHEDRQGLPFVGPSGQLLNRLLEGIGLRREDVYICNVNKCLRYNAMVQLGDGSWERIGRLVRSRYEGSVMSVDANGRLVRRRVTGWYASPIAGRRVFRLTYRSAKHAGTGQVSIQLTGDHEVMTDRGFVAVEQLPPGSKIATGQGLSSVAYRSRLRHASRRWPPHSGTIDAVVFPLNTSRSICAVQSGAASGAGTAPEPPRCGSGRRWSNGVSGGPRSYARAPISPTPQDFVL